MHIPLLKDLIIIFILAILIILLFKRLRIPVTVGLLCTGLVTGPSGLGLIENVSEVQILAEIGIVLLLFEIGIEFSIEKLLRIRKIILIGGTLQVLLTIIIASALSKYFQFSTQTALVLGMIFSLSSTAVVLKILQERGEAESLHGVTSIGILIFQDLVAVPMMLFIPLISSTRQILSVDFLLLGVKSILIIVLTFFSARYIIPFILKQVAQVRSRELFLLTVVTICFSIAAATAGIGLSLSLGAFLAGLIISESEYSAQSLGFILPFRDLFTSIFFISIGMLLDLGFASHQIPLILSLVLIVLITKTLTGMLAVLFSGYSLRIALISGLILCQIGEFSLILADTGLKYNLLSTHIYQLLLATTILTMALSPALIGKAPTIAHFLISTSVFNKITRKRLSREQDILKTHEPGLSNHLVIVGFGINGSTLAGAAAKTNIPFVVIEMNAQTVARERSGGTNIIYGDATYEAVLHRAHLERARILVITISDPLAARLIIERSRQLNPGLYKIVRTRYQSEIHQLQKLGVQEIIVEEYETSIELLTRILNHYLIPRSTIEDLSTDVRAQGYAMFRTPAEQVSRLPNLPLEMTDIEISSLKIETLGPFAGKTIAEMEIRKKYDITLLAIKRDSDFMANPPASEKLRPDDIIIVMGTPDRLSDFSFLVTGSSTDERGTNFIKQTGD